MASSPKTTTQTVEPWSGAKSYLTDIYKDYSTALDAGMPQQYQGNTVADQSAATGTAQQMALAAAANGQGALNNAQAVNNNIASTGGTNTQAMNTLSQLQNGVNIGSDPTNLGFAALLGNVAGGSAPGTSTYNNLMSSTNPAIGATSSILNGINNNYTNPAQAAASTAGNYTNSAGGLVNGLASNLSTSANPTTSNLNALASGSMIGQNPYLDASIKNAQSSIADQLKSNTASLNSAGAAFGRTGSGAQAVQQNNLDNTAAQQMSKVATDMYANQYNTDTQAMLSANNQVANNYNNDVSNQLNANNAASGLSDSQQQIRNAGTQLYGNLADMSQTQKNNLTSQQLAAANQLGTQVTNNANTQLAAAGASDSNYQNQISNLSSLLQSLSSNYNSGVQNQLANAGLQQSSAQAANSASNAATQNQLAAANQAGSVYQNTVAPAETVGAVGAAQDTRAQDQLNAQIDQWDYSQQMPLQQLANFASILNGGNYSTTTSTTSGNSALTNILGGLTGAVGLGTKLFSLSDARFKENIKYLYTRDDGVKWYSYNYKGENDNHVGPMAQQLQEVHPELVTDYNGKLFISTKVFEEAA